MTGSGTARRAAVLAASLPLLLGPSAADPAGAAPAGAVPRALHCAGPPAGCVDEATGVLRRLRDGLGCDHRAPFAAVYTRLEESLGAAVRAGAFEEPAWAGGSLNTGFVNRYLAAYHADRAGRPVPAAWRAAFDAARAGDLNGGQDVLLAANAHIQRDMPYVLAALGPSDAREPDYERVQAVLDRAYQPAVEDVARRYDPLLALGDARWNPVARPTAHELFHLWRATAWEHARRLAAAGSPAARRRAEDAIESNATRWAVLLGVPGVPGYRAGRDAYCRTHGGGGR
ncbi:MULTISPECIES: DUF5995 family protein [Streptomyces]|uniref:DUF5995 family protein n=1 Tax=Streptomyces TaxID=1883 RepID=UPI00163C0340|nr:MULTISPECIES: DUF5995 family protein [Streptomyces]MBC2874390.1 hypothetical protein [Streptomyces sp. TYQ1024]UBI40423.1 DUF5995 family protein [Streptomyces mobaraensis]UKW33004.1 DUF5995 family protein [Streptomyces sp. TYQ1024]